MIECQVCTKQFKQITTNHLKNHDLSVGEYKLQFPNSPLQDDSIIMRGEKILFWKKTY